MDQPHPEQLQAACRRVVAVINGKGGVGKTSFVANVGGLAADAGHRVLLVDLDPQANLNEDLGITQAGGGKDAGANLFDAIARGRDLVPSHPGIRPGLDLVAADPANTAALAAWLTTQRKAEGELSLARVLAPIADQYSLILVDVPPILEEPRRIALAAARHLVIPTKSDISSMKGMRLIAEQFTHARTINPDINLLGILLTFVPESGKAMRREARADIEADFGTAEPLFRTIIRSASSPAESARKRGLLAHELETFVPTKAEAFERLRQRSAGTTLERAVPSTAIQLAGDWASLTEEVLVRIAEREAAQ